jgi:hypothetical protein
LAATKALSNALEFANKNFDVDAERNYIMTVVCEACTSGNDEVKEHAYQCLCRIADVRSSHCFVLARYRLSRITDMLDPFACAVRGYEFESYDPYFSIRNLLPCLFS